MGTGQKLVHYSAKPLVRAFSVYGQLETGAKPYGLWVSVRGRDGWAEWCRGEGFGLDRLACQAEVILQPDARILRASTAADIDRLSLEYRAHPLFPGAQFSYALDWPLIARSYQGIIIAPYIWERRLGPEETFWYSSWDCASGCIWDTDAIRQIVPIKPKKARAPRST